MGSRRQARPDAALARIAARQHGAFSRRQAIGAGLSPDQIDRRIGAGRFLVLRRGVLAVAGAPATWEQTVMGAVLAGRADDLVGYATGARLWLFDPLPPTRGIDVISPGPRRGRTAGVIGHRTSLLVPADVARRSGIPVTSAARTLIDCGGLLGTEATGRALDDLLRRRLVTLDRVRATASRLAGPGRRTLRPIAHALATRVEGYELSDSDLEVKALQLIRRAGFPLPVQQHHVRAGARRFVLDLAYPQHKVAIELDGWEWHGRRRSGFDRTHRRLAALAAAGWTVLPFTTETIDDDLIPRLLEAFSEVGAWPDGPRS